MNRKSFVKFGIIILTVFLSVVQAVGQNIKFTHYGTDEGLPSPETYFTHQDVNGYMWFGTDRGLCRYDGYDFENFTTFNSNLTNNTIFKCYEAPNRNLWFTCYDGSISIYNVDEKKIIPFVYNDSLRKWYKYWPKRIDFKDSVVYIYGYNDNYNVVKYYVVGHQISFEKIGNCTEIGDFGVKHKGVPIKLYNYTSNGYYSYFTNKVDFKNEISKYARNVIEQVVPFNGGLLFADDFTMYYYVNEKLEKMESFKEPIQHVYSDGESDIFVLTSKYIYRYLRQKWVRLDITGHFTYLTRDKESNFWISTLNNGIYKFPNLSLKILPILQTESTVTSMHPMRYHLLLGTANENVFSLNTRNQLLKEFGKFSSLSNDLRITSIYGNESKAITTGGFEFSYLHNSDILQWQKLKHSQKYKGAISLRSDFLIYYEYEPGIFVKQGNNSKYYNTGNEQITCLDYGKDDKLRIGTLNGLWIINLKKNDTVPLKYHRHIGLTGRINKIVSTNDGRYIYATGMYGVIIQKGDKFIQLSTKDGLPSNVINSIDFKPDTVLWVGTNKGVSRVIIKNDIQTSYIDMNFNTDDGLLSNYVYSVANWNGSVYISTDNGTMNIPERYLNKCRNAPILNILYFGKLNSETPYTEKKLTYEQNSVRIKYVGICYKKPLKDFYRYRIIKDEAESGDYIFTESTTVDLTDLGPGEYVFEISCRNKNNVWSESKTITFGVIPHFTQTNLFRSLLILMTIILIILIVWIQVNRIRNKYRQEKKIQRLEWQNKESELAALRNQMNPHFIFNALNSIQSYVLENDIKTASLFIQQFSKLMRENLKFSMTSYITIESEMNFLKNYLWIEQLRFPKVFDFSVKLLSKDEGNDILIPPLIIQPIVENCIKHAFPGINYKGLITVNFTIKSKHINCVVMDNGVGINYAKHKKRAVHRSMGIQVVENRLGMINDIDQNAITFTDLSDEDPDKHGTKVVINIPLK